MKETNKTLQDLKIEIEAINKTQTEDILKIKMLGIQTGTREASFTNRTQKVEDRISDIKDMKEEMDTEVKENVKYENS